MNEYLTVSQAASLYGVTKPCIYLAISTGRLLAIRIKSKKNTNFYHLYIEPQELNRYQENKHSRRYSSYCGQPIFGDGETSPSMLARELGFDPQTLYYAMRAGKVPYIRKGYAYVLKTEEAVKYIENRQAQKKKPKKSKGRRISKYLK